VGGALLALAAEAYAGANEPSAPLYGAAIGGSAYPDAIYVSAGRAAEIRFWSFLGAPSVTTDASAHLTTPDPSS
ncbi:MAG: hypothetical protein JSW71_03150, partial [Gemmatimonadota bacterium]